MLLALVASLGLVQLLVYVLIFLIVIAVLWWLVNSFLPEPLKRYALGVIVVLGAIFLIYLLLAVVGGEAPRL